MPHHVTVSPLRSDSTGACANVDAESAAISVIGYATETQPGLLVRERGLYRQVWGDSPDALVSWCMARRASLAGTEVLAHDRDRPRAAPAARRGGGDGAFDTQQAEDGLRAAFAAVLDAARSASGR